MGTELYQHLRHHQDVGEFFTWVQASNLPVIGIDNSVEAVSLERAQLPKSCVLLFGQEGSGLSKSAREICVSVLAITQFGSTRSMNAGAAAAIAMHTWVRQHGL
jgi:tRNA G18 (ribose-2'-O)-methylase SpoU